MFIESHRLSTYKERATDVSVVLDLMIHDIDIISNFVRSKIKSIHAAGIPVISGHVDIANARIEFENGCVANVTASRISTRDERKIRLFQRDAYISVDFANHEITIVKQSDKNDDRKAHSQSKNIDKGIAPMPPKIAEHYFQLVFKHDQSSSDLKNSITTTGHQHLLPIPDLCIQNPFSLGDVAEILFQITNRGFKAAIREHFPENHGCESRGSMACEFFHHLPSICL